MHQLKLSVKFVAVCALIALSGCVHVEFFHPDVEGTYHLGADRTFWNYEGQVRHVEIATPIKPAAQEPST